MQMAPSPIKRDKANHWDGTTMDIFLQTFEMKSSSAFHR